MTSSTQKIPCTKSNFHPPCLLGSGGFADVMLERTNGKQIARKYLHTKKHIHLFQKQYQNLKHLKDKNICKNFICLIGKYSDHIIEMKYLKNYVTLREFQNNKSIKMSF